jgi:predicted Na+-dependent transporter
MELIVMILVPLPLGFFVRKRIPAFIAYIAIHAYVFTFQTANLLLEWANGSTAAFGSFPDFNNGDVWAYGVINMIIYGVGLWLVEGGHRLRARRGGATNASTG